MIIIQIMDGIFLNLIVTLYVSFCFLQVEGEVLMKCDDCYSDYNYNDKKKIELENVNSVEDFKVSLKNCSKYFILRIDIKKSNLPEFPDFKTFESEVYLPNLQKLIARGNGIKTISTIFKTPAEHSNGRIFQEIDFSHNSIQQISNETFGNLKEL